MPKLLWLYSSDFKKKKLTKVVSCCIIGYLTTKLMSNFYVGDQIKAKLIELPFRCHIPVTGP